jgi:hypothetical protein
MLGTPSSRSYTPEYRNTIPDGVNTDARKPCVELYLHCQRPCIEVTLRRSRACRLRSWREHAVTCLRAHNAAFCHWRESAVTCLRAHTAVAGSERPEERAMERRAVGRFLRAAEPCQSASCPALIALIDRRGKHKLPCYGLNKRRPSFQLEDSGSYVGYC